MCSKFSRTLREPADQYRQGAPHQEGGEKKDKGGADQSEDQQECTVRCGKRIGGKISNAHACQPHQRNCSRCRHSHLNPAVKRNRPGAVLPRATERCAARGEPSHEYGEHGGKGVRCMTKNQAERCAPSDLIDQSGGAGKEKTCEQSAKDDAAGKLVRHGGADGSLAVLWCQLRGCTSAIDWHFNKEQRPSDTTGVVMDADKGKNKARIHPLKDSQIGTCQRKGS